MPEMKNVIIALIETGVRDQVKNVIGAAPVNENFSEKIEPDGYAEDAGAAVQVIKNLLKV
jgi:5-methyltetrahydrofolate--homocysteine methyltransferase